MEFSDLDHHYIYGGIKNAPGRNEETKDKQVCAQNGRWQRGDTRGRRPVTCR